MGATVAEACSGDALEARGSSRHKYCADSLAAAGVLAGALFGATWPIIVGVLSFGSLATGWWMLTADASLAIAALQIVLLYVCGVLAPFFVHEWMHAVVALTADGVRGVVIERTLLRFSVIPVGTLGARAVALGAAAGPGACGVIGVACVAAGAELFGAFFLGHLLFLLPCFGDGRMLFLAIFRRNVRHDHGNK